MSADAIGKALSRWPEIDHERQTLASQWPAKPEGIVSLQFAPDVRLSVICGDAHTNIEASSQMFDAWYLDGFAPSRNPDLWSLDIMTSLVEHTSPGGTFATYAAAGFVRRNLQAAGFTVERRPGYGKKREMLSGTKA